jgi:hypothetical protein
MIESPSLRSKQTSQEALPRRGTGALRRWRKHLRSTDENTVAPSFLRMQAKSTEAESALLRRAASPKASENAAALLRHHGVGQNVGKLARHPAREHVAVGDAGERSRSIHSFCQRSKTRGYPKPEPGDETMQRNHTLATVLLTILSLWPYRFSPILTRSPGPAASTRWDPTSRLSCRFRSRSRPDNSSGASATRAAPAGRTCTSRCPVDAARTIAENDSKVEAEGPLKSV